MTAAAGVSGPGSDPPALRGEAGAADGLGFGGFADVDDAAARLAEHGYLTDRRLATTVLLLSRLEKPLLLEGPAGVGKTELAKTVALASGRRLLRLQCYEGQDESKALYEWDYGKQMLYVQMLREKIAEAVAHAPDLETATEELGRHDSVFFSERFLASRPLLEAVRSEQPVVLLVDEVDRSDEQFEAILLEMLAEFQVSVPELGTFTATHRPWVVLTSNDTRDLSPALKRRCLHLSLDYPDTERELAILQSKDTGLDEALARQLVQLVRGLRELELRKAPSISEAVDWARTLTLLGARDLDASLVQETLSVVLKYDKDVVKALDALPRLLAEATGAEHDAEHDAAHAGGHGHGGAHGHSHGSSGSGNGAGAKAGRTGSGTPRRPDGVPKRGNLDGPSSVGGATGYYGSSTTTPRTPRAG